ncbi:MAG: hypothetical protein RJA56_596, partial [Pseudomonadota bacterium]
MRPNGTAWPAVCRPSAPLRAAIESALVDPNFVAIGEIGLDFFIPMLCEAAMREKQDHFFREQLR